MDRDAQPVSSFANATFEKRLDTKSLPDVARVHASSAKCEAGCPGRNVETADLGKRVEDLLRYPITEVFLITFRAQIGEGQHRDGANFPLSLLAVLRFCFHVGKRERCRAFVQSNGVEND